MAEAIEVAIRDFLNAAAASTGKPDEYLKARAAAHHIVAYELDLQSIPMRSAELFIVGAYQQFESYLYDVVADYDEITGLKSRGREKGEAPFDWALDVLPGGLNMNKHRIWRERYLTLEYYRQVRNLFSHTRKDKSSVTAAYRRAERFAPVLHADYGLRAPSPPGSLQFDDFLLFTRLIKYVATDLNRICEPDSLDIVSHALRLAAFNNSPLAGLPTERANADKRRRRIAQFYSGKFGCRLDGSTIEQLARVLP